MNIAVMIFDDSYLTRFKPRDSPTLHGDPSAITVDVREVNCELRQLSEPLYRRTHTYFNVLANLGGELDSLLMDAESHFLASGWITMGPPL